MNNFAKRAAFFLMAVLIGVLLNSSVASAKTECSEEYLRDLGITTLNCTGDSKNCNPVGVNTTDSASASTGCVCSIGLGNGGVALIGSDNAEKIFRFFVAQGLPAHAAAGIVGNAYAESTLNPASVSGSGGFSGLFQWSTNSRFAALKKWTASKGLDPLSLDGQLQFALYEAQTSKNGPGGANDKPIIEGMKIQPDVEHAAWYWGRYFEIAIIGGSTSNTPLTNVQALKKRTDFAKQIFAKYGGGTLVTAETGSGSGPAATQSCGNAGQFIDGFTVYSQYDPKWKNSPYGSSTIGVSGCGPSAMAMIITALTGTQVTPVETAKAASDLGLYISGSGSSWSIGPRLAEKWGLKSAPLNKDLGAITGALQQGKLVIAPGAGASPFTSGGHFIVIRGITPDGKFKVGDSGHSDTSAKDWDPGPIITNMRDGGVYAISK